MTQDQIYQNIAQRTGGDIYLGVVGPVRSGKSTFIKRFAELMLLPRIKNEARRARAHDELPQSAAGRTIMTTEPKFIPEKAVKLELSGGGNFKARLIDCVGYMVDGALGHEENEAPRLVKSPWFDHEVPFDLAAETGTRCVIRHGGPRRNDGRLRCRPAAGGVSRRRAPYHRRAGRHRQAVYHPAELRRAGQRRCTAPCRRAGRDLRPRGPSAERR